MIKYPVAKPDLSGNELKYVTEAIKTGWISHKGKFVKQFGDEFAKRHGAEYGIPCSSGTNALTLALAALKIGPGDEVIVPEFTMIASAFAVSYLGATPVFVDCQYDLNISPGLVEAAITDKTKAIMAVHIYGRRCNMESLNRISHEYNIPLIEDSCEAHGIEIDSRVACYSLFANKIITSGEGGICITDDENLANQMSHLVNMAFDRDHTFLHKKIGYNFRMTNLQAGVALAQLERMDEFLAKRKQIEKWYDEELKDVEYVFQKGERDVVWMYDILIEDYSRDDLRSFLSENGIETRLFFKVMSEQGPYLDDVVSEAELESQKGLYLPTYTDLTKNDIKFICDTIKAYFKK
jgi:perosamine synthetase